MGGIRNAVSDSPLPPLGGVVRGVQPSRTLDTPVQAATVPYRMKIRRKFSAYHSGSGPRGHESHAAGAYPDNGTPASLPCVAFVSAVFSIVRSGRRSPSGRGAHFRAGWSMGHIPALFLPATLRMRWESADTGVTGGDGEFLPEHAHFGRIRACRHVSGAARPAFR